MSSVLPPPTPHGPRGLKWAKLSRELSFLGGVDKPVAGGARPGSVGGQLLRKPLTLGSTALSGVFFAL